MLEFLVIIKSIPFYGEVQMSTGNKGFKSNVKLKKWLRILGIILIIFSFILYAIILYIPFTPFSPATKGIICTILIITREISFWLGVVILGKEFVTRYLRYINVMPWLKKITKNFRP